MKKLLFILIIYQAFYSISQTDSITSSWDTLQFKTVKAYIYNAEETTEENIIKNGELHPTVVDTKGASLNKSQIKRVLSVISGKNNGTEDDLSWCYEPHHGLVFYDESENIVGYMSICFSCGNKNIYPYTSSPPKGLNILAQIMREVNLPVLYSKENYAKYAKKMKQKN